jgi:hypothetical protein
MTFPSWFHLAAALVSAGVPDAEAEQIARAAMATPRPMLWLRKEYDDRKDTVGRHERTLAAIAKVVEANRSPEDNEALGFVRSEVRKAVER